jgi:hypothetical protein
MTNLTIRAARILAAAALLALAAPQGAKAAPVLWTLSDLVAFDGSTASGSFVYDAGLNAYSAIDITTTPGPQHSGAHYTLLSLGFPASPGFVSLVEEGAGADQTGFDNLFIVLSTDLSDAGGVVPLTFSQEGPCGDPLCSGSLGPLRLSFTGTLRGTPLLVEVPEPAALTLLGGGLLALGAVRRRRGGTLRAERKRQRRAVARAKRARVGTHTRTAWAVADSCAGDR